MPRITIFCFLGLLFLLPTTRARAEHSVPERILPPAAKVHVVTVNKENIPSPVEVVGTVEAKEIANIAAKVTGTITALPVNLGSVVQQNQILVEISAQEISARLLQAQAQLSQARRNLTREQSLLQKKATTPETVKSMQDMFAVAEAAYQEAQIMLGYTTIKAPFPGVVTRKLASVGNMATPGTLLLQVENNQQLQIVTAIPESLAPSVQLGDTLHVKIPAATVETTGTVTEIAPSADPLSRTAAVKINIDRHPALRTGQFARVTLTGTAMPSLFVPATAILAYGQMDRIFVVESDRAKLVLVRTGMHRNGRVEILAGLQADDKVIIDNNRHLVNGQPVTIIP